MLIAKHLDHVQDLLCLREDKYFCCSILFIPTPQEVHQDSKFPRSLPMFDSYLTVYMLLIRGTLLQLLFSLLVMEVLLHRVESVLIELEALVL